MKKCIIIVCNGTLYPQIIKEIQKNDFVIGVDRAAYWLIHRGVVPSVAIGDFDSIKEGEFEEVKKRVTVVKKYSPEKDFTDTELALRLAIKKKPQQIVLYGGSGTRIDHELGTLHLLELCYKHGISAVFRDETNEVVVVGRGRTILNKRKGMGYVSVIPITKSIQITLQHFKYTIEKKIIYRGQTIGISNEFTGRQAEITVHRGIAFVIQSRD
jgi:thiamine pyrophosphokinase